MNVNFAGKVVLVAGGTGGLGRTVSLMFLAEGATVVVTYRNEAEFEALKSAAEGTGVRLDGRRVDVTDEAAVGQMMDAVTAQFAQVDVLVNTVGGYAGGIKLWELDGRTLEQMLSLNLRAGFVLAKAAASRMLKQKSGAIVNVASKAAFDHAAGAAAYAASKAAAVAMMDCLAEDLKGTGVRVNTIVPSIIDTEANRKAMPGADFGSWPKPEEIARVVLFLASEESRVVHGAAITVYGAS